MNLVVIGDGIDVTEPLRQHATRKFSKVLENCVAPPTVKVILKFSMNADKNFRHTATVMVSAFEKPTITRTETTGDMYESISLVGDKVWKEISRQKGLFKRRDPPISVREFQNSQM